MMKRVYFGDMEILAAFMFNAATHGKSSLAALHYEQAKELLHEFAQYDEIDICSIDLEPEDWNGYDKEYYVTLTGEFGIELYIEKAYDVDYERYLKYEDDYVILAGEANSKIIKQNFNNACISYEAIFDGDDIDCEDCDLCACACEDEYEDDIVHYEIDRCGKHYEGTISLNELLDMIKD